MTIPKTILKVWLLGTLSIFGVLIGGFLLWTVWKSAIEPRTAAQLTCASEASCLFTLVNGSRSVRVLGFSPDGTRLVTKGGNTRVHDTTTGKSVFSLNPSFDQFSVKFMGERSEIVAVGRETIEFYDYDGELLRTWRADPDEKTTGFTALPQLDGFALAQDDGIAFYRLSDGQRFTQLPDSPGMSQLVASADGAILAAYQATTESIHVWPLAQLNDAMILRDVGKVSSLFNPNLQISADGSRVAAHNENTAFVWQTVDGALVETIQNPEFTISTISLSADGLSLAVGYTDGFVEVWSLSTGELVQLFEHRQQLSSIQLSPDGSQLAVGLRDDAVITRITAQERWQAQQRYARGNRVDTMDRFLTPNTTYIETKPGFAIVWQVGQ
jgi:WD40 repeat protein